MTLIQGGTNPRHVSGWLLIALGICLVWLWENFRETFGGNLPVGFVAVEIRTISFLVGVASLIAGALYARGGWAVQLLRVPLRYVVGAILIAAAATTVLPLDYTERADTWVAFRTLRPSLSALSREVPRGLTSMECDLQLGDHGQNAAPDPGCKNIFATRVTRRSPTEDSLYSAMVDAQVRGFFDIEMRPTHFALVRTVSAPGVRKGFLKLHETGKTTALPQQLFLHQVADVYPLGEGWFHFVTR